MKKKVLVGLLLVGIFTQKATVLFAQNTDSLPTVNLNSITVSKSRSQLFREDYHVVTFDSIILNSQKQANLSELLSSTSSVYVKSNGGSGGLSTLSLRGSASNQTSVTWNGFPMNSLTTGDIDLSMIPVDFAQDISIIYGASGALSGSGTFGGSVNISNSANWTKTTPFIDISVTSSLGSYENYRNTLKLKTGIKNLQTSIVFFQNSGKNDFEYSFYGEKFTQKHNRMREAGFIQNLYIKLPKKAQLDFGIWLQRKSKEIAPISGSEENSQALQNDTSFRSYLKYQKTFTKSALLINSAFMYDYLHYTDNSYKIDSKIKGKRLLNEISLRIYQLKNIVVETGALYSYLQADVSSYAGGKQKENNFAVYSIAKYENRIFTGNVSLRKDFYSTGKTPFLASAGFSVNFLKNYISFRGNISNKFRMPTFNEKYWQPGGNENISPEQGIGGDIGLKITSAKSKFGKIEIESSYYTFSIHDFVQWVPDKGYSSPKNLKQVWSRGIEESLKYQMAFSKFRLYTCLNYSYTRSTNEKTYLQDKNTIGKQLIYVPLNTAKVFFTVSYSFLSVGYSFSYSGSRQTTEDNNYLYKIPPYNISNVFISCYLHNKKIFGELRFKINNLFDADYQIIRAYPMEGRNYMLSFSFGFSK